MQSQESTKHLFLIMKRTVLTEVLHPPGAPL